MDGEKFVGRVNVKKAFQQVFTAFPDAKWSNAKNLVAGDRGFSDGKIAVKNSYRKNRNR